MKKTNGIGIYGGGNLRRIFVGLSGREDRLLEIRVKENRPAFAKTMEGAFFLDMDGNMTLNQAEAYCASRQDMEETLQLFSHYSLYAFQEELANGFITIEGGHRVGLTGQAVMEKGHVKALKHISGFLIRISHEVKGCADKILPFLLEEGRVAHTMIIAPPGCGKTTLLRDLVRQLSDGKMGIVTGQAIGLVDERSEIAGCFQGVPQNDVGIRTDVLDRCPKADGMLMLLRSMAPSVIAVDEIGRDEDFDAIEGVIHGGVSILCTVHGNGLEDLEKKPAFERLLRQKIFERYVVLSARRSPGEVCGLYGREFHEIISFSGQKGVCL